MCMLKMAGKQKLHETKTDKGAASPTTGQFFHGLLLHTQDT